MSEFIIRKAEVKDVPFLVQTILEAEKAGTDKLTYSTVFGLDLSDVQKYLAEILNEEIDGCELSVSSFLVAEKENKAVAALSAWIEGYNGLPSAIIKGNLLHYILPKGCIQRASLLNPILSDLHLDCTDNSIQIGAGFVDERHRGKKLLGLLNFEIIRMLVTRHPEVNEIYAQIFSCNIPSIRTYEKAGFEIVMKKKSSNIKILEYMPSNEKILYKINTEKFLNTRNE